MRKTLQVNLKSLILLTAEIGVLFAFWRWLGSLPLVMSAVLCQIAAVAGVVPVLWRRPQQHFFMTGTARGAIGGALGLFGVWFVWSGCWRVFVELPSWRELAEISSSVSRFVLHLLGIGATVGGATGFVACATAKYVLPAPKKALLDKEDRR